MKGYREPDVPRKLTAWDRLAAQHGYYAPTSIPGDGSIPDVPEPIRPSITAMLADLRRRFICLVIGCDTYFGEDICRRCGKRKPLSMWR